MGYFSSRQLNHIVLMLLITFFMSACGGSGDGESNPAPDPTPNPAPSPSVKIGVFVDSLVVGVSYQTETKSGVTDADGKYEYIEGENVTFSIGGIVLGSAIASPVVTPVTIVDGATDASNPVVLNIIRLLLTLDADGDPSNGLDLTAALAAAADSTITVDSPTFEADVASLVETVKGAGAMLVDASIAAAHFDETLHTSWGTSVWGDDCWGTICS